MKPVLPQLGQTGENSELNESINSPFPNFISTSAQPHGELGEYQCLHTGIDCKHSIIPQIWKVVLNCNLPLDEVVDKKYKTHLFKKETHRWRMQLGIEVGTPQKESCSGEQSRIFWGDINYQELIE